MRTWVVHACVFVLAIAVASESKPTQLIRTRRGGRLCGSQLAEALAMVCDSVYFVPRAQRAQRAHKAEQIFKGDTAWRDWSQDEFMDGQLAHGFLPKETFSRQTRQGVVDECCRKSCSIDELRSYCG